MVDDTQEQDASVKIPTMSESSVKALAEDVDPALAEWLTVDAKPAAQDGSETESETDADSVNSDVKAESEEWFPVELSGTDNLDETLEEAKEHHEVCCSIITCNYSHLPVPKDGCGRKARFTGT